MIISIVIPTYNAGETIRDVFRRIYNQKTKYDLEIICIDSGSKDRTVDICRAYAAKVILIPKGEFNHGLTRDKAVQESHGEYVVLMTQDAVPANEYWLNNLVSAAMEDSSIAGVYSRQIPRIDCHLFTRYHMNFYIGCKRERRIQAITNLYQYPDLNPWEKFLLFHFANVSSCIRKDVWKKFPFGKRDFGEDMSWAKRVLEAGYKIIFEPESAVIHSHNYSCLRLFKRLYVDHQNLNRLIELSLVPKFSYAVYHGLKGIGPLWHAIAGNKFRLYQRICWYMRALPYAMIGPFAQYLGAKSNYLLNHKSASLFKRINGIIVRDI